MEKGLVSIVVPNLNYAHFLPECIESVLKQTYKNWELIIVDDNSTDGSREVVQRYIDQNPDLRIRLFHNKSGPSGTPTPVNIGIRNMKGEYFSWLSSDDVCKPEKLERLVSVLEENPDCGMVHSRFCIIDGNGNITKAKIPNFKKLSKRDFFLESLSGNLINGNTVLVRKSIFEEVGLFEERWNEFPRIWMVAEVMKWLQITLKSKVLYLNESIHLFRRHGGNEVYNTTDFQGQLFGFMLDRFLSLHSSDEVYQNLSLRTEEDYLKAEIKILLALKKYSRVASYEKRVRQFCRRFPSLIETFLGTLHEVEKLSLVAGLAKFLIQEGRNCQEIERYDIDLDILKFLPAEAIYSLASALKKGGHLIKASQLFKFLLKLDIALIPEIESGACYHLGEIMMQENCLDQAYKYFSSCISLNPDHQKAILYLEKLNESHKAAILEGSNLS